jgi:anti-sigma B factor antagonist
MNSDATSNRPAAHSALAIEIHPRPSAIIVALSGSADLPGSDELERKLTILLAQRPTRLIFDFSRLTMLSSMAMGSLLRSKHAIERSGGRVSLVGVSGNVLDSLRRARLADLFSLYESVDAAVAD